MKTTTLLMNKSKKDTEVYRKAYAFIQQLIPKIKEDLNQKLSFLETVEPVVNLENYSPRISIKFKPKGKEEAESGVLVRLGLGYEEELKRNQEQISLIITEIAKRYDLNARAGIFENVRVTIEKNKCSKRVYSRGLGEYTLQPHYEQFRDNKIK